jgi:hypothetical protein
MWFIILRSHTHSRDASYKAIISESLVEADTNVCFVDFQEIVVPPCKNTKPICDMSLWGCDK